MKNLMIGVLFTGAASLAGAQPAPDATGPDAERPVSIPRIQIYDGPPAEQAPPGEDWNQPPPPVNLLANVDSTLTSRESAGVRLAQDWIEGTAAASAGRGHDGAVTFRFGAAMPSIVCAPLHVCLINLEPGEQVNQVEVGDPVRWQVTPAISGQAARPQTSVVIKPTDIGLTTNMAIATDRRIYNLRLVSRRNDWMPAIGFSYPEVEAAQWAAVASAQAKRDEATVLPETGQVVGELDFEYSLRGDRPTWRPVRVYHDGLKTYIQFPPGIVSSETPALVAIGPDRKEQLVNYRMVGNRYVVDKVLDRAALVSGVGRRQVKVELSYTGARK